MGEEDDIIDDALITLAEDAFFFQVSYITLHGNVTYLKLQCI